MISFGFAVLVTQYAHNGSGYFQGPKGGGPWSPGALKFLLWSPEPYHFTDWSPDPFLAVEPGAQRHFARSPEPSIFKFDHSSSQIALILDYCLFVFVCAC